MHTRALFFLLFGAFLACGGDSSNTADGGPDGTTNNDGSIGNDGATNDSGGSDGSSSDGTTGMDGSTGTDGGLASITCGTSSCPLPTESCCVDPGPPLVYACSGGDAGACQGGMVAMQCMSAADCPSADVCCLNASTDPATATCTTTCSGPNRAMLCNPSATPTQNRCGDAGVCGTTNADTWNLNATISGTCGDQTGPF